MMGRLDKKKSRNEVKDKDGKKREKKKKEERNVKGRERQMEKWII